ncbi:MAG: DUF4476 domain-containing protein [Raineya sp.]|jgi:hypothetical protein|nr:DUF4476 domain-containing protein [Raineya sp.]
MKKHLLTFSFVFLFFTFQSKAQNSSISFSTLEGETFLLYMNGNQVNQNPETFVRADNLWTGVYWIKIVLHPQATPIILEKKIPVLGIRNLAVVVRKSKRGNYKLTVQSVGSLGDVLSSVRTGRIFRDIPVMEPFPQRRNPNPTNPKPTEPVEQEEQKPSQTEINIDTTHKPIPSQNSSLRVLDSEFTEIKQQMENEISDEEKLRIAKFSMKNTGYFSSEQVAILVGVISFDKEKLDLAKFGYEYTYDRYQYYTKVSKMLKTNESKKALFDYLDSK